MKPGLMALRRKIRSEREYVGVKPFSHNIIGLVLAQIAKGYGQDAANRAIRDCKLGELGWSERK